MSEEMARALGAKGATTVEIAGKQCTVRPLGIQELAEIERDCLERFKRSYLKTFADNKDLLKDGEHILMDKMESSARWDVNDLPIKLAWDADKIIMTEALKKFVVEIFELDGELNDERIKLFTASALDQGLLDETRYRKLSGHKGKLPQMMIDYVNWWITGCYEGMITTAWTCFKTDGVTRKEVIDWMLQNKDKLSEVTREIERLSAPAAKNG